MSPAIRAGLREVQTHLETTYSTARSELRKGFTDMDSAEVHITLFAIHANQARLQQVTKALEAYQKTQTKDSSFRLELKGLGSWTSKAGNIILYADLAKDSQSAVRLLAKKMRDFVVQYITEEENAKALEMQKVEEEMAKASIADRKIDALSTPSAAGGERQSDAEERKAQSETDNVDEYEDEDEDEDEDEENEEDEHAKGDEEDDEDEDEDEDEEEDEPDDVDENEDTEEDFPGLWFDDPRPDIYIPHVTILNSDPSWDRKLRVQLADKGQAKSGRAKSSKRSGGARARATEPFGWDYNLFRSLRNMYTKFSFGTQTTNTLELQSDFVCLLLIPLR